MPNVKDFYMDPASGNVEVEFDNSTTAKCNMGQVTLMVPVYEGTWVGRPAVGSVPIGSRMVITDVPVGRKTEFFSTSTMWIPVGGEIVLGQSGVPGVAVTGTTSAVTADLITVPGGLLGPNGTLIIEGTFSSTSNANVKTLQVRFATGPVRVYNAGVATGVGGASFRAVFANRGSESVNMIHDQIISGTGGGGGITASTLNTSVDQVIQSLVQLAVGTDSVTLERWAVIARPF